jgi:hypothetical protein
MVDFLWLILLVLVVLFIGVIVVIRGALFRPRRPGKNWMVVEGRVYIYRVHTRPESNGEERPEPGMRCLYQVNNVTYQLTLDDPSYWNCTQREWENIARYYPREFVVRVHYDPRDPRRAVVEPMERLYPEVPSF